MSAAPSPIALDDLDREELLQLVKERCAFGLRPRDLLAARWRVLTRREEAAWDRDRAASDAYLAKLANPPARGTAQSYHAYMAERERLRLASVSAEKAWKRARAAANRAYAALTACHDREVA